MMKLINRRRSGARAATGALFLLLLIFFPAQVCAQDEQAGPPDEIASRSRNRDGDLVRLLNLTPEQIEKIRAIRVGNREARRSIVQRVRAARIALDRAIYVENADETVVEQRARELAEAQAAQVRLQAMVELGIRRILTAEQLQTFRSLRLRAESQRRGRRLGGRQDLTDTTDDGRPPRRRRSRP